MELSIRIRKIREAYNLSQSTIANKLNITPSAYGQIERNAEKSSFMTLGKIAEAIGVTSKFLLDIKSCEFIEKNKL